MAGLVSAWKEGALPRLLFLIGLFALAFAYLHVGELLQNQTNRTDKRIRGGDQKNNLKLAHWAWEERTTKGAPILEKLPHLTDGVVAPLWPWVASFLPGAEVEAGPPDQVTTGDRQFFEQGRRFHLGWTAFFLIALGLGLTRIMTRPAALVVTAGFALAALLPRTAFFQPEPLLYVFFLLAWLAALLGIHRRRIGWFALCGALAGLGYLTKSSAQPMLIGLVGTILLFGICQWRNGREWLHRGTSLLVLIGFFLLVSSPRLIESHRQFGDPFHSYPSYWMWLDDFDECFVWMQEHPDTASLEKDKNLPSPGSYLSRQGVSGFMNRLIDGSTVAGKDFLLPNKTLRGKKEAKPWKGVIENRWVPLLAGILSLVVALALLRPKLERRHWEIVVFVGGTFLLYLFAIGFYVPIGKGERFLLLLYGPLVLTVFWGADALIKTTNKRWPKSVWTVVLCALLGAGIWRLLEIVGHPVFYTG